MAARRQPVVCSLLKHQVIQQLSIVDLLTLLRLLACSCTAARLLCCFIEELDGLSSPLGLMLQAHSGQQGQVGV
jgi:hypothetical protein